MKPTKQAIEAAVKLPDGCVFTAVAMHWHWKRRRMRDTRAIPSFIGSLHSAKGDLTTARSFFLQAQRELRALRERGHTSFELAEALVEVNAALGERQELEREGEALLKNAAKDVWRFPRSEEAIARSYAILGDAKRAVPLLQRLLETSYDFSITLAKLRLDPIFDPLRNDPRFQKLVAAEAPKSGQK